VLADRPAAFGTAAIRTAPIGVEFFAALVAIVLAETFGTTDAMREGFGMGFPLVSAFIVHLGKGVHTNLKMSARESV
jgi:hypothetical protein